MSVQCVVVWCSVVQCDAVQGSVVSVWCSVLQLCQAFKDDLATALVACCRITVAALIHDMSLCIWLPKGKRQHDRLESLTRLSRCLSISLPFNFPHPLSLPLSFSSFSLPFSHFFFPFSLPLSLPPRPRPPLRCSLTHTGLASWQGS